MPLPREGAAPARPTSGVSGVRSSLDEERLRACRLFSAVPSPLLGELAAAMRRRRYRRGEVVFHQGDPGDALHVIDAGSAKVVLPSADGGEAIIATLRVGDFFGELALLDGSPRSTTIAALEPLETFALPRDAFRLLLDRDGSLRDALLASLARELRRLTGQVEELHFLDLPGRLATRLVRLAQEAEPTDANGPVRLDWPYTQSDLASMIGGTRQTVNRLLAELVDDGLVVLDRDTLVVPDLAALAQRGER